MPSCLGLYTDKNMVKYAKLTTDRNSEKYTLDAFGVKFYDNIQTTVNEIALEVGMPRGPISVALSNEEYYNTKVFNNLKKKDITDLVTSEYESVGAARGVPLNVSELRYLVFQNTGIQDKNGIVCVATTKSEIANIGTMYDNYKVASISPLPASMKNLFENQGIEEDCAIINIEDRTTITVLHSTEIQYLDYISLGASEIIDKLAEKYNSYAKGYEACKKVSAYLDSAYDASEDEDREVLDVIIPTLYEIRQTAEEKLKPFLKNIKNIYITGTGAVINNIDLYFSEVFTDKECTILRPFFVNGTSSNTKDIIEVNSAIALALDGLGKVTKELDFNIGAKAAVNFGALKDLEKTLKLKERFEEVKNKISEVTKKLNSPPGTSKKKRGKVKVDFDDGEMPESTITSLGEANISPDISADVGEKEGDNGFGVLDLWLGRFAALTISATLVYSGLAIYSTKVIAEKKQAVEKEIASVDVAIANAKSDAAYLDDAANKYIEITNKLSAIIAKINKQSKKTYDIPNFLSKLMFIMPANVSVKTINIQDTGAVTISAESGQYAQLGYLVSKLKIENALLNVDMQVKSVDSNIKIEISGVLP